MCYLRFPVFQKIPEEIRKQKSMKDIRLMHVLAKLDRETPSFCCSCFLPFPLQCYNSVETMEQKPGYRHPVTQLWVTTKGTLFLRGKFFLTGHQDFSLSSSSWAMYNMHPWAYLATLGIAVNHRAHS